MSPQPPLDERLVHVALDLLAEEGLERLTLRRIARRAGVSHGAPLRHFQSFAELCSEVAAQGFALLTESMDKAAAQLPPGAGSRARLAAGAGAYVAAAVANPGLFALMFRTRDLDPDNPLYQSESMRAFDRLLELVRAAQDAGWRDDQDTRRLAGSVWATVHGLATLWSLGAFSGPVPGVSLDDALSTTLDLVLDDQRGETT